MKHIFLAICILIVGVSASLAQDNTPKPIAPFSPAVMVNGTLYLSGQLPRIPETGEFIRGDIKKATTQSMKNLGVLLRLHGLDFEDLVMVNIYMTDMDNYQVINEIYASYFKNQKFPARAAVQVVRLPMDVEVEISGIAVKRL